MMRHRKNLKQFVNPCRKAVAVTVLCLGSLLGQALAQGAAH